MKDPFPIPCPRWLARLTQPYADYYSAPTLPLHIHEILLSALLYHFINLFVSPRLSRLLFPRSYPSFNLRTRMNWDVHVVSLFQSVLISGIALWVLWSGENEERRMMTTGWEGWKERVWGYTGAEGMVQALATGYFVWDLWVSARYVHVFGPAMLAHAVSALAVYGFGYRPFVNYYAPIFILYELSSPFLNIHWFCDKLSLTGSRLQLYNGICLILTFFSCRLVWGIYQSVRVFADIYRGIQWPGTEPLVSFDTMAGRDPELELPAVLDMQTVARMEMLRFYAETGKASVPLWLAGAYLSANIVLNVLNVYWFGKMIATIRKRFEPPFGTKEPSGDATLTNGQLGTPGTSSLTARASRLRRASTPTLVEGVDVDTDEEGVSAETSDVMRAVEDEVKSVEVEQREVRRRRV